MKPGAIVFDLDGTLIDSQADIFASVLVAACDQGRGDLTLADLQPYVGYPLGELYAAIFPRGDGSGRQRFVQSYRAHYAEHGADTTRPYPGVAETLARLGDYRLAVATAKPSWSAASLLGQLGLASFFHAVVGSEDLPAKPDPACLLLALQRLGASPAEAVMVGDTERDVLAARAAGMRVVAAGWGGWDRARLTALTPDALAEQIEELPGILASW